MPLPVLKAHGLSPLYLPTCVVRPVFLASCRIDFHAAASAPGASTASTTSPTTVRIARTLAGQLLLRFHRLLVCGSVLEGEGRDRDAGCRGRHRLVAAARLGTVRAVRVLAVELLLGH